MSSFSTNNNISFKGLNIKIDSNNGVQTAIQNAIVKESLPELKQLAKNCDIFIKSGKGLYDSAGIVRSHVLDITVKPLNNTRNFLDKILGRDVKKYVYHTDQRPYLDVSNNFFDVQAGEKVEPKTLGEFLKRHLGNLHNNDNTIGFIYSDK